MSILWLLLVSFLVSIYLQTLLPNHNLSMRHTSLHPTLNSICSQSPFHLCPILQHIASVNTVLNAAPAAIGIDAAAMHPPVNMLAPTTATPVIPPIIPPLNNPITLLLSLPNNPGFATYSTCDTNNSIRIFMDVIITCVWS
eukprot:1070858_1